MTNIQMENVTAYFFFFNSRLIHRCANTHICLSLLSLFFLQLSLFSLTFCLASALATLLGVTGRYSILSSTPVLNTTLNSAAWMSELFTTPADGGMQQLNSGSCVSEQKQRWGCCAGLRARCKNEVCEKKAALGSWVKGKTQERRGGEIF